MDAEQRRRDDRKALLQLALAMIGFGAVVGSLVGAAYGTARETVGYWTAGEVEAE